MNDRPLFRIELRGNCGEALAKPGVELNMVNRTAMFTINVGKIAQTTPRADAIAEVVGEAYQREVKACSLYRRAFNLVYGLTFRDGSRAVARLSAQRPRGKANTEYEAALLDHLGSRGVAVAGPIRTALGDASVSVRVPEGVVALMLTEYIPGETPGRNLENIRATGISLARLHSATVDFSGPRSLYALELPYLLDAPLERMLAAPGMTMELGAQFERIAAKVRDRVASMELQVVHCHGDCHGANNFMVRQANGDLAAAFFDFDDAGPGFVSYDLCVYLWANISHTTDTDDPGGWKRWQAYIDGYTSSRGVSAADYAAIPIFLAVRMFWLIGEYAGRLETWGTHAMLAEWLRLQPALLEKWLSMRMPLMSKNELGGSERTE